MDFDDLLGNTVHLLREHPEVLQTYQERFKHVLVDEYQDTNLTQNALTILLAQSHGNICVVGDSDQSIYQFRGADVRNILDFEKAFPNTTVVVLDQNYRSTQNILDAANAVISQNIGREPKELWTEEGSGTLITKFTATDETEEAKWVTQQIYHLNRNQDQPWSDLAVFYRTNVQSRAIEEQLVRQGIPYRVIGGTRFYDRKEIKDAMAYLRLAANPTDEVAAKRILNVPKRGIGNTSVTRIDQWSTFNGTGFLNALNHAEEAGVTGRALTGINTFIEFHEKLKQKGYTISKATVYNTLNAFSECGIVSEVTIDPSRTYYDSRTTPHHHFFNIDTGQLVDIASDDMSVENIPRLPDNTQIQDLEIVVKISNK